MEYRLVDQIAPDRGERLVATILVPKGLIQGFAGITARMPSSGDSPRYAFWCQAARTTSPPLS
jgi:hypothetical protein